MFSFLSLLTNHTIFHFIWAQTCNNCFSIDLNDKSWVNRDSHNSQKLNSYHRIVAWPQTDHLNAFIYLGDRNLLSRFGDGS